MAPLVKLAEAALHEIGVRTRVPLRAPQRTGLSLEERRRLRRQSYAEIERSVVVIHIPAPAEFAGTTLHRELQHACRCGVPILLLVARRARADLNIALPRQERVRELAELTDGQVVESLADLARAVAALPSRPSPPPA